MPTKKPVTQIVLEQKDHDKLKKIAEQENRSISNQGSRIIEKYIDEFEAAHGEIKL